MTLKGKHPVLHGGRKEKLYKVWDAMKQRCSNKNHHAFPNYGGRGITVCREWGQYPEFRDWARTENYKEGLFIDRIDNLKGYKPSNCRFVTASDSGKNGRYIKLTVDKVNNIRKSYKLGKVTMLSLSKEYEVCLSQIWRIIHNLDWRHQ